ncbi:ParB/RepB/Spo0J family partition protein [Massilia sp. TSP1-1-2]|uniref:ParB/RepB/Spo0J family partition protein n=1 Tax=Massilia sp. TSP1-1-2 TaxID=2804649 RepID=UPI003CE85BD8
MNVPQTTEPTVVKKKGRLSGLLDDSAADGEAIHEGVSQPAPVPTGEIMLFDMDRIHPDPDQPRSRENPGFSPESIAELASSFGPAGPKSPISLRDHPTIPGDFMINHGERRYLAAKVKGLSKVGGFLDNNHNEDDQVIENVQREDMTPREIAAYIGRKLKKNFKKKQIADLIGKSPSFITQHAALLDLPEPIAKVFNSGRANDVTVVSELVTAFKKNPKEVGAWLEDETQEVTRGEVKLLREFLDDKRANEQGDRDPDTVDLVSGQTDSEAGNEEQGKEVKKERETDPERLKKAIIQVEHNGRPARLILTRRPPAEGYAWMKYDDDGAEFEASLSDVVLIALLEG